MAYNNLTTFIFQLLINNVTLNNLGLFIKVDIDVSNISKTKCNYCVKVRILGSGEPFKLYVHGFKCHMKIHKEQNAL